MTLADLDRTRIERAKLAVGITFGTNGLAFAGWFARAPAVRHDLHLSAAGFGLLLLCISVAGIAAIPVAGLGLVLAGLGNSSWDVAMNVEGADVERRLGRTIMPRFHAGFSLGTVLGAAVSAAAAAAGIAVSVQLYLTAALTVAVMVFAVRGFLPHVPLPEGESHPMSVRQAWLEPRTILIGLILLGFGFAEGTANDWLAISLVDGYHATETVGAIGYGAFVVAMTLSRLFGGYAIERWGRVTVLRATAVVGVAGLLLVFSGAAIPLALLGGLLWGVGSSLGFPVGMSSAADDPVRSAIRVSVAGSIGYASFLAGPPLIGVLAQHLGVLNAILCALVSLLIGVLASGAARPLKPPARD